MPQIYFTLFSQVCDGIFCQFRLINREDDWPAIARVDCAVDLKRGVGVKHFLAQGALVERLHDLLASLIHGNLNDLVLELLS